MTNTTEEGVMPILRRSLAAALVVLVLAGCSGPAAIFTRSRLPHLDRPRRPKMKVLSPKELEQYQRIPDGVRDKIEYNVQVLTHYAGSLEMVIDTYNDFGGTWNERRENKKENGK